MVSTSIRLRGNPMSGAAALHRPLPRAQYWIPACFGFAVLMLGYVALLLFWELGANPAGVPGLFHYRDATWGDGLLLPFLAAFLVILIRRLDRTSRQWPTWIAGVAGRAPRGTLSFVFLRTARTPPHLSRSAPPPCS